MNPAVKLQYMDNIRWIREAAKHQLVRAWPGGGQGGPLDLAWVGCRLPPRREPHGTAQVMVSLRATLPWGC